MNILIDKMKLRIEESANAGGSESVKQIMEYFISEGYSNEEVKTAFSEIFKTQNNGEYD